MHNKRNTNSNDPNMPFFIYTFSKSTNLINTLVWRDSVKAGSFMYCQWGCQLISSLQKATCNMNLFHFWEFILHIYLHTCKMAEVQWCLVLICIFWLPSEVNYLFIGFDHFSVSLTYQSVGVVFVCLCLFCFFAYSTNWSFCSTSIKYSLPT